jgi:glycosyltransferase involved in cell wall biosynthesis
MPNALLEAMATALPIVASRVDGNRELLEDRIHGWLVPPEDAAALAKAIERVLGDPEEARRRGAAARQHVMDHYSVDAMVISWERVLMENLEKKQSRETLI